LALSAFIVGYCCYCHSRVILKSLNLGLFRANFSHLNERLIMNKFNYSFDKEANSLKAWANDALIFEADDYEPMSENEAYNIVEELFIEYLQSK
jgi:hypothetical protein